MRFNINMFFIILIILSFISISLSQYDNVIYGYNYPYTISQPLEVNEPNLFTGIAGDFLSAMTSALISGMGNGVTETFLPGTTSINNIYPQQVGFNNLYSSNYYSNKLYPYSNGFINKERNNPAANSGYENIYSGSLITTPYTSSNLFTMSATYNPSSVFNGKNGPKPLGSTFGGYSNAWGRPIVPIISSKDTTAFNGKFLRTIISKMGYQRNIQSTTISPIILDQSTITTTILPKKNDNEVINKIKLERRKRNIGKILQLKQ
uniref:Uncharacterized protein n=1 Tax=Parastrongyloides trichosuri TaxID=131310 RepID=A0A0N5A4G6_PARTI